MPEKVPEIVLTGGPCAGKTTALAYLQEKLADKGVRTLVSPESATLIINSIPDFGRIAREEPEKYFKIQRQMILLMLNLRQRFVDLANVFPGEKRAIIYDRGIMDAAAYMTQEAFGAVLKECGITITYARDSYDAVIHLVTAAKGAEHFYTKANNVARQENLEEARLADDRTLRAWTGHPHLKIIDNSTGFEEKLKRLLQATTRALGIPVPLEIERKFLLKRAPDLNQNLLVSAQKIFIEQMYLVSSSGQTLRIRKRSQNGSATYYKTYKIDVSPGIRQETEEIIKASDYLGLQTLRDPNCQVIRKHRYCFVYKNQYFELDIFIEPEDANNLALLEIELTEENDYLELPPFIEIQKEVTNDYRYTNHEISKSLK